MPICKLKMENTWVLQADVAETVTTAKRQKQINRAAKLSLVNLVKKGHVGGGKLILVKGPMPVALALSEHILRHMYKVVGVHDNNLGKYVVAFSCDRKFKVGNYVLNI